MDAATQAFCRPIPYKAFLLPPQLSLLELAGWRKLNWDAGTLGEGRHIGI